MSEEEQKYFKCLIGFTFDSDDIKYIEKIVDKKDKEIERLNNIIDELSQYLEEDLKQQYRDCGHRNNIIREVYDKLNELKGSDKE